MELVIMILIDCAILASFTYLVYRFKNWDIMLCALPIFVLLCAWGEDRLKTIFLIVACHMIGDYLFQNEFIANTKGSNWYHLFVHCILYAVPFAVVFGWCWQLALITVAHFPIDALKARWKKTTYAEDQALHYLLEMTYLL